jgi:uncharacterized membrane protein YgaE (UPF0421/DUF939 family)
MKFKLEKIGMRNIKTAIAVVISILVSKLLKTEYPFYAAIASIISMQSSVEDSLKTGRNRVLGTIVGAFVGYICALISPESPIFIGIGIVIVIYLCNVLNWKDSASIAGVVFCAIMLNLKGNSPFLYSLNRILDTLVGIIVAIVVNYFVMRPEADKND